MAAKICPKCKENSFLWFLNERTKVITWNCFDCDYEAKESDTDKSICEKCENTTKIKMKDKEKEFWRYSDCNATNDI